jgi:hypothetical protein
MKSRALPLAGLLLASCAGPRPLPFRVDPADLQPLEPGMMWTYTSGGTQVQVRRVEGVSRIGRFECRVVEARTGDAIEKFWMRSEKDGLKVYRLSDGKAVIDFDDPQILIKYPAAPGVRWTFEERHGPVTLHVEGTYEADEDLPVLKGIRRCARVRLVKSVERQAVLNQTSWYAPGVGLVRTAVVFTEDGQEVTRAFDLLSCNFLNP